MRRLALAAALRGAAFVMPARADTTLTGPMTAAQRTALTSVLARFPPLDVEVVTAAPDGSIDAFSALGWHMVVGVCGEAWLDRRVVVLRRGECEAIWPNTLAHELCHVVRWDQAGDSGHGPEWLACWLAHLLPGVMPFSARDRFGRHSAEGTQ